MKEIDAFIDFLATLSLNSALAKIKTVEVDLRGNLNPTLWLNNLFFEQGRWLNFYDFFQYYLQNNEVALRKMFADIAWNDLTKGLEARLYRTQFGMLTEYHAYLLAKSVFGENNVQRSKEMDRLGVDFQVFFQEQTYNIHIFVDTERAWAYRKGKIENKQGNALAGWHVNLPYSLANNRFNSLHFLKNGFGIYQTSYFIYLKNEMLANKIQNNNIIGTTPTGFAYIDKFLKHISYS